MNLTDETKKLAFASEMDYIGVAPVDRFQKAPEGWRPNDLLKNCQSVISMAIKIPEGVRQANELAYAGTRHGIYIYMMYGYVLLNEKLDTAALRVARFLEKEGHTSMPTPASPPFDNYANRGVFAHRHAAVAAGLGEFGWNLSVVTPDWGPRVRLVSVLTEAKLTPDPMYSGKKLCDRKKCSVCVIICPMHAISMTEGVKVEIGGRSFEYAKMNKWRCLYALRGLSRKALGRRDLYVPDDPQPEDFLESLRQENPWQTMERLAIFCGRCIIHCPCPSCEK